MENDSPPGYDIIGDIHGYCDALEELLHKMDYQHREGCYRHPEGRKVIFVGDLLDRGPGIRETVKLAMDMHEQGQALMVLGNHEYNAVCYCSEDDKGIPCGNIPKRMSNSLNPRSNPTTTTLTNGSRICNGSSNSLSA